GCRQILIKGIPGGLMRRRCVGDCRSAMCDVRPDPDAKGDCCNKPKNKRYPLGKAHSAPPTCARRCASSSVEGACLVPVLSCAEKLWPTRSNRASSKQLVRNDCRD